MKLLSIVLSIQIALGGSGGKRDMVQNCGYQCIQGWTSLFEWATGRRNLDAQRHEHYRWCGISKEDCEALESQKILPPLSEGQIEECEEVRAVSDHLTRHLCCDLEDHMSSALTNFVHFQHDHRTLFDNALSLDQSCGTNFQSWVSFTDMSEAHMSDYDVRPSYTCDVESKDHVMKGNPPSKTSSKLEERVDPSVTKAKSFQLYVVLFGKDHLGGFIEFEGQFIDTINWFGEDVISTENFHHVFGAGGEHRDVRYNEAITAALELSFPINILAHVIRKIPENGETWNVFGESCAGVVYSVVATAFETLEECVFTDSPVHVHFPVETFDLLVDVARETGRGDKLTEEQLNNVIRHLAENEGV